MKEPCYHDDDKMPFGKHKGEPLSDVPAAYLNWLWKNRPLSDKMLSNYIENSLHELKQEFPHGVWD